MQFEGRTGPQRQAVAVTSFDYDPRTEVYTLRLDDGNNPEFWLKVTLPQHVLQQAVEAADGDEMLVEVDDWQRE